MLDLTDEALNAIKSGFRIPPKPVILEELQRVVHSSSPSLEAIGSLVAADVGLASITLKAINSPFFGMSRSISDVKQAVFFLGASNILNLATAEKLKQALTGRSSISLERFWDTASDIANAMMHIGRRMEQHVPLEDLHAIGLFHDAGIAAMALKYDDYRDTLMDANNRDGKRITLLEDEKYNTNHTIVGYYLATSWQLPKTICECVLNHHELNYLQTVGLDETHKINFAILKTAEHSIEEIRRYHASKDWPHIGEQALEYLDLSVLDLDDIKDDLTEMLT
ncbi:MAG: HDOD domain-containing protein [Gammaproteobacteria bacterium]|nr:HDOD domain-containing protein [Gammaproteobacteria bacterium]